MPETNNTNSIETVTLGGFILTQAKNEETYNPHSIAGYAVRMTEEIKYGSVYESMRNHIIGRPSLETEFVVGNWYFVSMRTKEFFNTYKDVLWNTKTRPGFKYPDTVVIPTGDRTYVRLKDYGSGILYYKYIDDTWVCVGLLSPSYYKLYCHDLFTCASQPQEEIIKTPTCIYIRQTSVPEALDTSDHMMYAIKPMNIEEYNADKEHPTEDMFGGYSTYSVDDYRRLTECRKLVLYVRRPLVYDSSPQFTSDSRPSFSTTNALLEFVTDNNVDESMLYFIPTATSTCNAPNCTFKKVPIEQVKTLAENGKLANTNIFKCRDMNIYCKPIDCDEFKLISECASKEINGRTFYAVDSSKLENLNICAVCGELITDDSHCQTVAGFTICRCHALSEHISGAHAFVTRVKSYHGHTTPMQLFITKDTHFRKTLDAGEEQYEERLHQIYNFKGLGFELEVDDCDYSDDPHSLMNNLMTERIALDGGNIDDVYFETDGSLNNGFEIISQPHTVEAFWEKKDRWAKMLHSLSDNGYHSHDAGTCGLHVHVSRKMFGDSEQVQDLNIAKVYQFFDKYWDDILKISRRTNTEYCDKNSKRYCNGVEDEQEILNILSFKRQSDHDKEAGSSHHVALNNGNRETFEYRLGRGTLNAESFFAWVDFVLTTTKNALKNADALMTNKSPRAWLEGLQSTTAAYIYKRGAFREEIRALYDDTINVLLNAQATGMHD